MSPQRLPCTRHKTKPPLRLPLHVAAKFSYNLLEFFARNLLQLLCKNANHGCAIAGSLYCLNQHRLSIYPHFGRSNDSRRDSQQTWRGKEKTKKTTITKGVWIVFWALTSVIVTIHTFNFSLTSLLEFSFTKWELTPNKAILVERGKGRQSTWMMTKTCPKVLTRF